MFNFIEHQVARCLCDHIGHLVALEKDEQGVNFNKADKTQRLDMLVELMDMLANISLHEQIFHHMHTFLPIESFFTTLDDIFLLDMLKQPKQHRSLYKHSEQNEKETYDGS